MISRIVPSFVLLLYFMESCERTNCDESLSSSTTIKCPSIFVPKYFWSTEQLAAEGNRLFGLGKHKEALSFYKRIIKRKPEKLDSFYVLRGKCYIGIGDCDAKLKAAKDFQSAFENASKTSDDISKEKLTDGTSNEELADDPSNEKLAKAPLVEESVLAALAEGLLSCGSSSHKYTLEAEWCYSRVIELNPRNARYFANRGLCIDVQSSYNYKEAIENLKEALRLDSSLEESHEILKNIIYSAPFNEIVKDSLTLLKNNVLLNLCDRLKRNTKYREAVYCFNEAIGRDLGDDELTKLYLERALCFTQMKQLEMAIFDYKNRVMLNLHDVENCWYPFIVLLLDNQKFNQFEKEVIAINDQDLEQLGYLLMTRQKEKYAIRVYSETIKRDSCKPLYYKLRGDCYLKLGKMKEALSDMKIWVQHNPDNEEDRLKYKMTLITNKDLKDLVDAGFEYIQKNKLELATNYFNGALSKDENCEICYEKRAFCHWKSEKYENAISDLEKLIELANWDVIPQIDLCEVLVDANQRERAKKILKQLEADIHEITSPATVKRIRYIREKMNIPN